MKKTKKITKIIQKDKTIDQYDQIQSIDDLIDKKSEQIEQNLEKIEENQEQIEEQKHQPAGNLDSDDENQQNNEQDCEELKCKQDQLIEEGQIVQTQSILIRPKQHFQAIPRVDSLKSDKQTKMETHIKQETKSSFSKNEIKITKINYHFYIPEPSVKGAKIYYNTERVSGNGMTLPNANLERFEIIHKNEDVLLDYLQNLMRSRDSQDDRIKCEFMNKTMIKVLKQEEETGILISLETVQKNS